MNSIELRARRAALYDSAKKFYDEHQTDDGTMSAEDAATFDKMCADVDAMKAQIDRAERLEAVNRELAQPTATPLMSRPEHSGKPSSPRGSAEYKAAFWDAVRGYTPADVRNVLQIGTDAQGGYLCPDEYERTLIDKLQDENIMRRLATIVQSDSGERRIPVVASHGSATWMDEGDSFTDSDDAFGVITLGAYR